MGYKYLVLWGVTVGTAVVLLGATLPAGADMIVSIKCTSGKTSAVKDFDVPCPGGSADWTLSKPVDIKAGNVLLGRITNLSVQGGDPSVNLKFAVSAAATDTTFDILSPVVSFSPLSNPQAYASAGLTLTSDANGATATGLFSGDTYQARYNGSSVFANLVPGFSIPGDQTVVHTDRNPATGFTTIPGSVSSIESEFNFTLSALEQASGTSRFEVDAVPEPATLSLLVLGGLAMLRRRRQGYRGLARLDVMCPGPAGSAVCVQTGRPRGTMSRPTVGRAESSHEGRKFQMKCTTLILLTIAALVVLPLQAKATPVPLGTAGNFAVLAGSTVTNTGLSVISNGDVGVSPGSAITGFPPGVILPPYTTHAGDAVALQAQNDLTTAYNVAAGLTPTQNLTGQDLGGLTLLPGVYFFSSSAQLTGTLLLNAQGDPNAQWVFQIGSTLTTASASSVVTINDPSPGCDVFWQVGSSATLGTGTAFEGHILALTSITMTTGSTIIEGSDLARNGAVTLDTNTITNCPVPEPATMTLVLAGGTLLGLRRRRVVHV
jgi:hypothetical protein